MRTPVLCYLLSAFCFPLSAQEPVPPKPLDVGSEIRPSLVEPTSPPALDRTGRKVEGRSTGKRKHVEDTPSPADTVLGGTVPALWQIKPADPNWADELLPSVIQQDSLVPTVPAKLVRYAEWLWQRYDQNADQLLQHEEWQKMPGAPQAMDIDADGQITREELLRHLALFGQNRTIHRPDPPPLYFAPKPSSDFLLFKPVAPPPTVPPCMADPCPAGSIAAGHDGKNDGRRRKTVGRRDL